MMKLLDFWSKHLVNLFKLAEFVHILHQKLSEINLHKLLKFHLIFHGKSNFSGLFLQKHIGLIFVNSPGVCNMWSQNPTNKIC
jgi:hypothetical protein